MDFTEALKDERLREVYEKNKDVIDSATSENVKIIWTAALKGLKRKEIESMLSEPPVKAQNMVSLFLPMLERKTGQIFFERKKKKMPNFSSQKISAVLDAATTVPQLTPPTFEAPPNPSEPTPSKPVDLIASIQEFHSKPDPDKVREITEQFLGLIGHENKKLGLTAQQVLIEQEKVKEMREKMTQTTGGFTMDASFFDGILKMMQGQMQMQMAREMMGNVIPSNSNKEDPKYQALLDRLDRMDKKNEMDSLRQEIQLIRSKNNNPELTDAFKRLEDRLMDMRDRGGNKADDWKAILELQKMGDTKESRYLERMTDMDKQRQQEQLNMFQQTIQMRLDQLNKTMEDEKKKPGADLNSLKEQIMAAKELAEHVQGKGPGTGEKMFEALAPQIGPILEALAQKKAGGVDQGQQLSPDEVEMINTMRKRQFEMQQQQAAMQQQGMGQPQMQAEVGVGVPPPATYVDSKKPTLIG